MGHPIRALALATAWLIACGQAGGPGATIATPAGSSETRSGSPTLAPAAQVLLPGTIVRATVSSDMFAAFADGGRLFAVATRDGPAPYLSSIQRYDSANRVWEKVFEDDARFDVMKPSAGRVATYEYREPFRGGGASDSKVLVVDLATGANTVFDAWALSAATFRGGGGAPRRAGSGIALGGDTVAWTRANELAGGEVEGELRIATLSDPAHSTTVGRSREWIEPLWIDGGTLVYLLGGTTMDDLRSRDLATGAERRIALMRAPGVSAGRAGIARSGGLAGWIDNPPLPGSPDATSAAPTTTFLHVVDLTTGTPRDLDLGTDYCYGLSGNAAGFAWGCKTSSAPVTSLSYFDPRAWRNVEVVRSPDRLNQLEAYANAFIWYDVVNGARRVNLLALP